jgi:RNA 3'-phosphate cyclase
MIEIDGSTKEGGGQVLRTAVALSVITKKSCFIFNIRKNRPNPGLRNQHLLGIKALTDWCGGKIEGADIGSEEIIFQPSASTKNEIRIDMPTAGSITLMLQTLIPPLLVSGKKNGVVAINFNGGATDTFFSPTISYFENVTLPQLKNMGAKIGISITKHGYYPQGGAKVKAEIKTSELKPIDLTERGQLKEILIISGAAKSLKNKKVAERQISGAIEILRKLKLPIKQKVEYYETDCPGSNICLTAKFDNTVIGIDSLGKIGKRAEGVGKEAAIKLFGGEKAQACLDKYMADQILPYMALAQGKSKVTLSEITNHVKTSMWVIEKFLDGKFETKDNLISWTPSS